MRLRLIFAVLLGALHPSLTTAQATKENSQLAAIGQAWGFLKYYHPRVARGMVDWDRMLVVILDEFKRAGTAASARASISAMLDSAGPVDSCLRCPPDGPDSVRGNIDHRWLEDSSLLGMRNVGRLKDIRTNRHVGSGRYVKFGVAPSFTADSVGIRVPYPSVEMRLLSLFKFWNVIRYFYPYVRINGEDWTEALFEFIPRVRSARDAREFQLVLRELSAKLNDSHVEAIGVHISHEFGLRVPPFEARLIDGRVVVSAIVVDGVSKSEGGVQPGDVLTHVDGLPILQLVERAKRFVAAGNFGSLDSKAVQFALLARRDSVSYTIERDGVALTRRLAANWRARRVLRPLGASAKMLDGDIGYLNLGGLEESQVDSAYEIVRGSAGLVIDLREYPRLGQWRLATLMLPDARPFAASTFPDSTYPGQVVWWKHSVAGPRQKNSKPFAGRIAILIDERTTSQGEFAAMLLRTAAESRLIGSNTAGADGNVTSIALPGAVTIYFTGTGIYYPDGRATQRVGIVPDIRVHPTVRGIRDGVDELLVRATQYIRTGK